MLALNAAMMTDGVVIEVADLVRHSASRCTSFISRAGSRQQHVRDAPAGGKIGKAASATLVESYIAAEGAKTYQVHDAADPSIRVGAKRP